MDIQKAASQSRSMAEAARKCGLSFSTFKRRATETGLYKPNQAGVGISKNGGQTVKIELTEILQGIHPQYQTYKLKKRLVKEGIKKDECEECGIGPVWNDKPLSLQLDHINGISNDHRLDNLRILCPNCHAQTDTWSGKNKGARVVELVDTVGLEPTAARCESSSLS